MLRALSMVLLFAPAWACSFDGGAPADTDGGNEADALAECTPQRSNVLGAWGFEELPSVSEVGGPSAVEEGTAGLNLTLVDGPSASCGLALQVSPGATDETIRYARIDDDDRFDGVRALDVHVREPSGLADPAAIVGREDAGEAPGQFVVFLAKTNSTSEPLIVVRLQDTGVSAFRCARAPSPGTWFHFAANLTAERFEIYIDGALQSPMTSSFDFGGQAEVCGSGTAVTLNATNRDLTIGAAEVLGPPSMPFSGGAIDNLRLFSAVQNFDN